MHPSSDIPQTTNDVKCFETNAEPLIKQFRDELQDENKEIYISDVRDRYQNQYIDLVQKGGGVWGVALIGFTYVLEKMGIRFLRMAGTSAGAINTVLMSAMGDKNEEKSIRLLRLLVRKNLFDFVDGHLIVKTMVRLLTKWKDPSRIIRIFTFVYAFILTVSLIGLTFNGYFHENVKLISFIICFICVLTGILAAAMLMMLWNRFKQAGLGLNPGETFLIWMKQVLKDFDPGKKEMTTDELERIAAYVANLNLKVDPIRYLGDSANNPPLEGAVTVITSEICTGNKIELPRMRELFDCQTGNPMDDAASLVRASMAIPFFFESFYVKDIKYANKKNNPEPWDNFFGINPPSECRLVDGGILSNFPVDIYVDANVKCPRYPTIGIDLNDGSEAHSNGNADTWNLFEFIGNIFNAARNHYDKAYIQKNRVQKKNIASVNVGFINWLKFSMSEKEKIQLFMSGVVAAIEFLKRFKADSEVLKSQTYVKSESQWDIMKEERMEMYKKMNIQSNA